MTVPEIVKQLRRTRKWRKQKTVTIDFPHANGTDDVSLHRLRRMVADHNYPIIKQGKTFNISTKFSFPNDAEGQAAARALREAIDYGEPAKIEGAFIKKWKVSDWWERLYGPVEPLEITISGTVNQIDVPVRFEVDTSSGTHVVSLDLRRVKGGHQGFTLSNAHERQPLELELVAKHEGQGARLNLHLGVKHPVANIFQTKDATDLLLALHDGVRMRLVDRDNGKLIVETAVPKNIAGRSAESLREWKPFLEKLCFVQSRIYKWGTVVITNGRVSNREAKSVEDFYVICRTGFIERRARFTAEFGLENDDQWPQLVEKIRSGEKLEIGFDIPDAGRMKILNVNVPLGPMRARQDISAFGDQVERALRKGKSSIKVVVPEIVVREEYPQWAPPPTPTGAR